MALGSLGKATMKKKSILFADNNLKVGIDDTVTIRNKKDALKPKTSNILDVQKNKINGNLRKTRKYRKENVEDIA